VRTKVFIGPAIAVAASAAKQGERLASMALPC